MQDIVAIRYLLMFGLCYAVLGHCCNTSSILHLVITCQRGCSRQCCNGQGNYQWKTYETLTPTEKPLQTPKLAQLITACMLTQCSVKDDTFLREHKIFDPTYNLSSSPIHMKLSTVYKFCNISELDKFGWNLSASGRSAHTWKYGFCNFLLDFFFRRPTDQTSPLIIMSEDSNNAVWCKEMPFGGLIVSKMSFEEVIA